MTLLLLSAACSSPAPAPAPEPARVEAPARPEKVAKHEGKRAKGPRGRRAEQDPQKKIPAHGVPDPLDGLTDQQICTSDTLLLLKYPFEELQAGTCAKVCCAADAAHWCCQMDWPFSDVPGCEAYEHMYWEIHSRYGFPFPDEEWQEEFGGASYYTARKDFDAAWMSKVAARNLVELGRREEEHVGCTP